MNRYKDTFSRLQSQNRIAFIPFAVAGDPTMEMSERILKAYVDAGADVLEIGVPFSDPIADGPVNQRSAQRAIAAGFSHASFFRLLARIRAYTDIPIGLLLYANSAYHLGYDTFCARAADAGIDSLLVADLPLEEADPLYTALSRYDFGVVHIVSELTPGPRIQAICSRASAFVYIVSRLGPTGTQKDPGAGLRKTLQRVRAHTSLPLCVGFGLSTPAHIAEVVRCGADGAIVGSALVSQIERLQNRPSHLLRELHASVAAYCRATSLPQPARKPRCA